MSGPRIFHVAHRERNRAPELGPHNRPAERTQALSAPFLRQIELPQAKRLASIDQMRRDIGLEIAAIERLAFEWNQFVINEAAHHVAQHLEFVGQLEIHVQPRLVSRLASR